MRTILLSGAGFSKNWGGPLASEVFAYLFGCPEISGQPELNSLLLRHQPTGKFENAVSELQAACRNGGTPQQRDQLDRLERALSRMFAEMTARPISAPDVFEFQPRAERMVSTFLNRFDAIFTLNQDVLLERGYVFRHFAEIGISRWHAWDLPGMEPVAGSYGHPRPNPNVAWRPLSRPEFRTTSGFQPVFKLNGSINWVDAGGQMILGGDPAAAGSSAEILSWYREQFAAHLTGRQTRLMIIGYGFNDEHINDVIAKAVQARKLYMFIVDPRGRDVLERADPNPVIPPREPLSDRLGPYVVGVSVRPLTETFGSDYFEQDKLVRFLTG